MTDKRELLLEGLNCANCGAKIEEQVGKLPGVVSSTLNFGASTLVIEADKDRFSEIFEATRKIVAKLEPDVVVKEKPKNGTTQKVYLLEGLDCANCAGKIEAGIRKLPGVSSANLDFISKRLKVEAPAPRLREIEPEIKAIVNKLEPDVVVTEEKKSSKRDVPEAPKEDYFPIIKLTIGTVIYLAAVFMTLKPTVELILFVAGYFLIGGEVVWRAVRNILRGQVFDENFLMAVATIGAFAIKQYSEAVAVMLFYQIGESFQAYAVNRSRHLSLIHI